jgi:hypothetical protein
MAAAANGLQNAPVTKCLMIAVSSISTLMTVFTKSSVLSPMLPLNSGKQLLRLLLHSVHFGGTPSIVLGCALLFIFRVLERRWGSRKYAACVLILTGLCTSAQLAFEATGLPVSTAPGISFVFALSFSYFWTVPAARPSYFLFVPLSDKIFTYILLGQMAGASYGSAATGLVCGLLYTAAFSRVAFSLAMGTWCQEWLPFLSLPGTTVRVGRIPVSGRGSQGGQALVGATNFAMAAPSPSEERVNMLMGLGFSRAEVLQALQLSRNDADAAANLLLSQS